MDDLKRSRWLQAFGALYSYSRKYIVGTFVAFHFSSLFAHSIPFARFDPADRDEIDTEDTDYESIGDGLSYRFPEHWENIFADHQYGFRLTTGSLDINRLFFREDHKAEVNPSGAVDFNYYFSKYQDLTEERIWREGRLLFRLIDPWYVGVIGYSDSFKMHGDVGWLTGLRWSRKNRIHAYYLSIDHYFNEKRDDRDQEYKRRVWEAGSDWIFSVAKAVVEGRYSYQSPVRWQDRGVGLTYEHFRRQAGAKVTIPLSADIRSRTKVKIDQKFEAKNWTNYQKRLKRQVTRFDQAVTVKQNTEGSEYFDVGVFAEVRNAEYASSNWQDEATEPPEGDTPDMKRFDAIAYTSYVYALSERSYIRPGMQAGHVRIKRRSEVNAKEEYKPIFGYEYVMGRYGRIILNSTFDLDEMVEDFPYQNGFPGWDGGNLQLMAVF